jgi:hypothetical protein
MIGEAIAGTSAIDEADDALTPSPACHEGGEDRNASYDDAKPYEGCQGQQYALHNPAAWRLQLSCGEPMTPEP